MDNTFFSPNSFENMVEDMKKKSNDQLNSIMVTNSEKILELFVGLGSAQHGAYLVLIGAQMACAGISELSDGKRHALFEMLKEYLDTEDDVDQNILNFNQVHFDTLSSTIKAVTSTNKIIMIFEYLLAVACVADVNESGISNIKKLFESWFK